MKVFEKTTTKPAPCPYCHRTNAGCRLIPNKLGDVAGCFNMEWGFTENTSLRIPPSPTPFAVWLAGSTRYKELVAARDDAQAAADAADAHWHDALDALMRAAIQPRSKTHLPILRRSTATADETDRLRDNELAALARLDAANLELASAKSNVRKFLDRAHVETGL